MMTARRVHCFKNSVFPRREMVAAVLIVAALVFPGGSPCPAAEDDPRARAVMEKVDARDDGDNMVADMKMVLIDKSGKTRERIMRTFSKDVGPDTYQIIFFTEPAQVKDTAFLTYDYDDPAKDDDQWLYLPALKKTKRIAASDKTDSFMGSDFSYADMTKADLENYKYQLIKEDEVYGSKVWVIEAVPVSQKVIDTFGYTKSLIFVRQDNYVIVRAVLWLADSTDMKYMDVKKLEQVNGIWVDAETHMTVKKGEATVHQTIMIRNNVAFNQKLDDALFTERSLEKGL